MRRIRARAFHYHYGKRFNGMWEIEDAEAGYLGSHELPDYSEAVVRYVEDLVSMLPQAADEPLLEPAAAGARRA